MTINSNTLQRNRWGNKFRVNTQVSRSDSQKSLDDIARERGVINEQGSIIVQHNPFWTGEDQTKSGFGDFPKAEIYRHAVYSRQDGKMSSRKWKYAPYLYNELQSNYTLVSKVIQEQKQLRSV